jgi:predicted DNA-binding transcriptional regulator AlpA
MGRARKRDAELEKRNAAVDNLILDAQCRYAVFHKLRDSWLVVPRAQPAIFPPSGSWPAILRAPVAAAYLGCESTAELYRRVMLGQLPRPHDRQGRTPVWYREFVDRWLVERLRGAENAKEEESILDLI